MWPKETLVYPVHVRQSADGQVSTVTCPLEDEAYAAEDRFVENWRRNSR
jgi:hypothetical protein